MKILKDNWKYIILIMVIIGLSIKVIFFNDSETTKILKDRIEAKEKENDSLVNNEIASQKTIELLKQKVAVSDKKNEKLVNSFWLLNRDINNKIKQDEENLNTINGITNAEADAYLSGYKFKTITKN